jgi:hypothetical protein
MLTLRQAAQILAESSPIRAMQIIRDINALAFLSVCVDSNGVIPICLYQPVTNLFNLVRKEMSDEIPRSARCR